MRWTHSRDDKLYGATILLAQLTKSDTYRKAVRRWLDYYNWRSGRANRIHAWWVGVAGLLGLIALFSHDRVPRVYLC
jgi:hypothetical protein